MLNPSLHYHNGLLHCDEIPVSQIIAQTGTPVYIYSLKRVLHNLRCIEAAFSDLDAHIHYSVKANANLALLRELIANGTGIDAVSAGEIHRALLAGAVPRSIVFAGVGKTPDEIAFALENGVGWFNVENVTECAFINETTQQIGCDPPRIALRFNPEVTANTHPHIATGHGGAKFGLTGEVIHDLLKRQADFPYVRFAGIHIHIGSQLHDTQATLQAVTAVLNLIEPFPQIQTINIGGGLPVAYRPDETVPDMEAFARTLAPLLQGYTVLLEPGRAIVADAGVLVTNTLYVKQQAGQTFIITDASMTELMRPALYDAHHEIVTVIEPEDDRRFQAQVVGPVCETTDVLSHDARLPRLIPGEPLAILTAGAYGMVMASNYNQRLRPPEVVVTPDGRHWHIVRRRETWNDLLRLEASL
jgi:diaminopimelate decarboxylase